MKKEIIINATTHETRIAIVEDDKLVELYVERPEKERMLGDIYKGKVARVHYGMNAAFIDIGLDHNAFLHFSDIGESALELSSMAEMDYELEYEKGTSRAHKKEWLPKQGQEIVVQITKEPINEKGPKVTTNISIPGRFLVLVPNETHVGISRKITNPREKKRLRKIASEIKPDDFGLIVRTVAEGKRRSILINDLETLMETWKEIEHRIKTSKTPELIYKDMEMASSIIRDLFISDLDKVIVDSKKLYRKISNYLKQVAPPLLSKLEHYRSRIPIFDAHGIEREIEKTLEKKIWLKNGGYIVIDHTEALVTVDVNSGKYVGKENHEKNSFQINKEAAKEIARQLRLRDIGGIIVIDFIDMADEEHKMRVYQELRKETRKDRARIKISEISEFGLVEMTRQRVRPSLLFSISDECPQCGGTGRVTSKDAVLTKIERWIQRFKNQSRERRLELSVHPELARHLREDDKATFRRWLWRYWLFISIKENSNLKIDEFRFYSRKKERDITDLYRP
ncbi:MAG: ribonuclease E/G [Fidelibacterota bacterium]